MKKILLTLLVVSAMLSCKKEQTARNGINCYECNFSGTGYRDVGCMDAATWDGTQFQDAGTGQPVDKSHCRIK